MSSDIYIPLALVLTHANHFKLSTDYNVDVDTARHEAAQFEPDWDWVKQCLEPVLVCTFGAGKTRPVEIFTNIIDGKDNHVMHICCNGDFLHWLMHWLEDYNYPYTII